MTFKVQSLRDLRAEMISVAKGLQIAPNDAAVASTEPLVEAADLPSENDSLQD